MRLAALSAAQEAMTGGRHARPTSRSAPQTVTSQRASTMMLDDIFD